MKLVSSVDKFSCFSPVDFRYAVSDLEPYLSEDAFTKYKFKVEVALIKTLTKYDLCPKSVAKEVEKAVKKITTQEVYEEEKRIRHDIRALVNLIKDRVSDKAKPFIHATATSFDIIDTARALMYKDAVLKIILIDMTELEKIWIAKALKEKNTLQIGRTHGQHAEPITFGFTMAQYVNRWGSRIFKVNETVNNLVGKFSGAVGAYNASFLLIKNPEKFEEELLAELGLKPAKISTQIVPPEPMTDFAHAMVSSFGVLANFADDMRHLQRTEIGEVGEPFEKEQVGSSTMPQKRNPINFENVKSAWKEFMPRMVTVYADQISEHQRDLTNSLSGRYLPELLVMFTASIRRMIRISSKLQVDKKNMQKNFQMSADKIVAEPWQILLSFFGHSEAHEAIRQLTMQSYQSGKSLGELISKKAKLKKYLAHLTPSQKRILNKPEEYIGLAVQKTEKICYYWQRRLKSLKR